MKKVFKKMVVSIVAAVIFSVFSLSMNVSAECKVGQYAKFCWTDNSISVTNLTQTSRLVVVSIAVYNKSTGDYLTMPSNSGIIGYGNTVSAYISSATYPNSLYSFKLYAAIYRSTSVNSGIAESYTKIL